METIERIANVAIILAVAVFLAVVVRNQFFPTKVASPYPTSPYANMAKAGSTITLPGVHFSPQRESLVLGISTTCHFCQDSLPFYKKLTSKLQGRVNVIAVLPQDQAEAEAFVKKAGLVGTQVVSDNLGNIGVYGTPTLMIVNGKGKVQSTWVGELTQDRQKQLMAALLPNGATAVPRG